MLKAQSLACRRGRRLVFRDVGFTVEEGGLLLVVGRNGSGKSSLLRMLAGLLPVFEGEMFWRGRRIDDAGLLRARVNYIGHFDALKPELTAAEMIDYWRVLRRSEGKKDLLAPFGLADLRKVPVRALSEGQKRRLALARLRIGGAPLWLLDEPATSLDDKGQNLLAGLIEEHRASGGIVLLATHQKTDFRNARHLVLGGS